VDKGGKVAVGAGRRIATSVAVGRARVGTGVAEGSAEQPATAIAAKIRSKRVKSMRFFMRCKQIIIVYPEGDKQTLAVVIS
jgi:hypothetical protein